MKKELLYSGWQVYKRILAYSKKYKWVLLLGVVANIGFAYVEVSFANAIQYLIKDGLGKRDPHFLLVQTPLFIIGAIFIRGIFSFVATYCMGLTGRRVVQRLREELYVKYLYQPASFFIKWSPGKLLSTLTFNTEQIAVASSNAITQALRAGGTVVFILIYMLILNWRLTVYLIFLVPVVGWVINVSSKRLKKVSKNIQHSVGDITHNAEESIKGHQVIKMFNGTDSEVKNFKHSANSNRQQDMKLIATRGISSPVIQFIAGIGFAAIIYFGSLEVLNNNMDEGQFVAFIVMMGLILKPLKDLTNVNTELQKGIAGAQSVFEILDLEDELDAGTLELDKVQGDLVFDKVNFSYNGKESILQDISFTAKAGETIALVGRSGSGKTTVASLLQRLYNPDQGTITIDGHSLDEFKLSSLREQIAIVSQNVFLFNNTIAHNIAYGQSIDDQEAAIIKTAKHANAWEFIERLPEQLDFIVGDNGALLSGGQRQRIAIARAMYKDAPILILDEATSALDSESERRIQSALELLIENRTTLVVAHRLSTIEKADRILVLDQGKIIEQGTHQQLLAADGEYTRLHQMQFSDS